MGSINKIVKKSPNFIKRLYYNTVPFSKRYGKVYEDTLSFLLQSSQWDEQQVKDYQFLELRKLLQHCYHNVPFYKQIFIENKWKPEDFREIEDLQNFPVLTKKIIMDNANLMRAAGYQGQKSYPITTSGSSGDKLKFYVNDEVFKKEAAFNMRAYLEQGAQMYDTPSVWLRRYVPKESDSPLWYYDHELKRDFICLPIILMMILSVSILIRLILLTIKPFVLILRLHIFLLAYVKRII